MPLTQAILASIAERALDLGLYPWTVGKSGLCELSAHVDAHAQQRLLSPRFEGIVRERLRSWPIGGLPDVHDAGDGVLAFRVPVWNDRPTFHGIIALGIECDAPNAPDRPADLGFRALAAPAILRALEHAARDLAHAREQQSTIEAFTTQLSDAFDTIELLYSVGRSMRDPTKPEVFLQSLCDRLHETMSFGWIATRFFTAPGMPSNFADRLFEAGDPPRPVQRFSRAVASLSRGLPLDAGPRVLEDAAPLTSPEHPQILAFPIGVGGRAVGVLAAGNKGGADPCVSSYDIKLVEAAAGFATSFLEIVGLYEAQRSLFMGTLHALTAAIDAKDRYTRGHSERVAYLASALAHAIGYSPDQVERVRIAGLVHDVGKIGVPEAVLTKAGRLTDPEFDQIKRHPQIGYNILRDIPLLSDVLPGVLHHHERWDGRGYPSGLSQLEIPEAARLIAVADTFDAMSSTRSYRPAMERTRVLSEIARSSGSQLDPAIVPKMLALDLRVYDEMVARHAGIDASIAA